MDESVVEGWVRTEGLPHVPERGRLLFDRAQVAAWAVRRGLMAKAGFLAPEGPHPRLDLEIDGLLRAGGIWRDVSASEVLDVLETVVGRLPGVTSSVRQLLAQRIRSTGGIIWAPVGGGDAFPHLRAQVALGRGAGILALLFLRDALANVEPAPDGQPITRLLFFVAPSPRAHLELLARLSSAMTQGDLRRLVHAAAPDAEIFAALAADEAVDDAAGTSRGDAGGRGGLVRDENT